MDLDLRNKIKPSNIPAVSGVNLKSWELFRVNDPEFYITSVPDSWTVRLFHMSYFTSSKYLSTQTGSRPQKFTCLETTDININ